MLKKIPKARAVSAVMARRPFMISVMREAGIPVRRANSACEMPMGSRNSSRRIRPGVAARMAFISGVIVRRVKFEEGSLKVYLTAERAEFAEDGDVLPLMHADGR